MDFSMIKDFVYTNWLDLAIILGIILVSLGIGWVVYRILRKFLEKLTAKTESDVDDKILAATGKVIYVVLFFIGLNLGLNFTKLADVYATQLSLIFSVAWILIGAYLAIQVLAIIIEVYGKAKFGIGPAYLIKKVTIMVIGFLTFILILNVFQVEVTPLLASLGIAGLAIALALQDTLANFFTGLYLTADQPFRPGDYIEIGTEIKGTVLDIGWRSTRLKTIENNVVIVPNKTMGESIIKNFSLPEAKMIFSVHVTVDYNSNPKKVEKIMYETSKKIRDKMSDKCVKAYDPVVRFTEFGDHGLKFKVFMEVNKRGDQFIVGHEVRNALFEAFKKAKIHIPYPTHTVYLKKTK